MPRRPGPPQAGFLDHPPPSPNLTRHLGDVVLGEDCHTEVLLSLPRKDGRSRNLKVVGASRPAQLLRCNPTPAFNEPATYVRTKSGWQANEREPQHSPLYGLSNVLPHAAVSSSVVRPYDLAYDLMQGSDGDDEGGDHAATGDGQRFGEFYFGDRPTLTMRTAATDRLRDQDAFQAQVGLLCERHHVRRQPALLAARDDKRGLMSRWSLHLTKTYDILWSTRQLPRIASIQSGGRWVGAPPAPAATQRDAIAGLTDTYVSFIVAKAGKHAWSTWNRTSAGQPRIDLLDLVQEATVKLIESIPTYDRRNKRTVHFSSYAGPAIENHLRDLLKRLDEWNGLDEPHIERTHIINNEDDLTLSDIVEMCRAYARDKQAGRPTIRCGYCDAPHRLSISAKDKKATRVLAEWCQHHVSPADSCPGTTYAGEQPKSTEQPWRPVLRNHPIIEPWRSVLRLLAALDKRLPLPGGRHWTLTEIEQSLGYPPNSRTLARRLPTPAHYWPLAPERDQSTRTVFVATTQPLPSAPQVCGKLRTRRPRKLPRTSTSPTEDGGRRQPPRQITPGTTARDARQRGRQQRR